MAGAALLKTLHLVKHGIPAGELSLQARILAVADIFEALTASDRVYRKPNTLSEALGMMARMCSERHIDAELFFLLVRSRAWRGYAKQWLLPEQLDEIDEAAVLAIARGGGTGVPASPRKD